MAGRRKKSIFDNTIPSIVVLACLPAHFQSIIIPGTGETDKCVNLIPSGLIIIPSIVLGLGVYEAADHH